MGNGIPLGAVWVSALVLLYSFGNLALIVLLVCLLWSFGERLTYVSLLCSFTALSTTASIIQQFHYATDWAEIKESQFERAVESLKNPTLAFGGASTKTDSILFFIQFYCYNAQALIVFFWATALFNGAWGFRANWLGSWRDRMGPLSKVFAVLFPVVVVALEQTRAVSNSLLGFFLVSYTTMLTSMSFGSILLALMLYKYIKTRRLVAGGGRRGAWWGSASKQSSSNQSQDISANESTESGRTTNTRTSIYDRVLVTRFTIGFVILAVFEVVLIVFSLFQSSNNASIAASGHPNLTLSSTVVDVVLFVPGVTPSLVTFLVFGTTKSWRQYRDMVFGSCGIRRRLLQRRIRLAEQGEREGDGLEFTRISSLPSLATQKPQDGSKSKEAEKRVRMFVKESGPKDELDDECPPEAGPSNHTRANSNARTIRPQHTQHNPTSVLSPTSLHPSHDSTLDQIGIGLSTPAHDPTTQPGRRREAWEVDEPDVAVVQQLQPQRIGLEGAGLQLGVLPPVRMSREEQKWTEWPQPRGDGTF